MARKNVEFWVLRGYADCISVYSVCSLSLVINKDIYNCMHVCQNWAGVVWILPASDQYWPIFASLRPFTVSRYR